MKEIEKERYIGNRKCFKINYQTERYLNDRRMWC